MRKARPKPGLETSARLVWCEGSVLRACCPWGTATQPEGSAWFSQPGPSLPQGQAWQRAFWRQLSSQRLSWPELSLLQLFSVQPS